MAMIKHIKKIKGNHLFVRKDDMVVILTGNDRGKKGRVLKVFPERNRIVVEGVGFMKRHTKPNTKVPQGGIVEKERSINASNVMVIDPKTGKPTRIGYRTLTIEGRDVHVRVSKRSGETLTG